MNIHTASVVTRRQLTEAERFDFVGKYTNSGKPFCVTYIEARSGMLELSGFAYRKDGTVGQNCRTARVWPQRDGTPNEVTAEFWNAHLMATTAVSALLDDLSEADR